MSFPFEDTGYLLDEHYEYAKRNGITENAARLRYFYNGWTLEEALTIPLGTRRRQSASSKWLKVAKQNGIHKKTFYSRLGKGWGYQQAATIPKRECRHSLFTKEELETAKQNGIGYYTLDARIRQLGWSKEKAITLPPIKSKKTGEI